MGVLTCETENFLQNKLPPDLLPDLVFREFEYYDLIANPSAFVNHTPQSYYSDSSTFYLLELH